MKATYVTTVVVVDPDNNLEVSVQIFKEDGGGMFGVDESFIANTDEPIVSPFGNGELDIEDI